MSFKLSRLDSQSQPRTLTKTVDSGTTAFNKGALLIVDAQDEYAEAGADPATITAVALHDYGTDSDGYGGHGKKEFPAGKAVAVAVEGQRFRAKFVGTAALGAFGVVRDTDSDWKVDFNETVATRFQVTRLLDNELGDIPEVEGYFLAANVGIM